MVLPKQSFSITSIRRLSPVEFISSASRNLIPNKGSLSPAAVIHPQLRLFLRISKSSSRVSLPRRVILSPVYSPAGLFSQSSLVVIPSENEEFNSFAPAAVRDLFSPAREHHKNVAYPYIMARAYASYNTVSLILRTSLLNTFHTS